MSRTAFAGGVSPFTATVFKKSQEPPPMGYMVPPVVEAVMKLEVGEGLEVPVVQRDKCNWSNQINEKLTALKVPIKVRQRTYKGVTTLWRVK